MVRIIATFLLFMFWAGGYSQERQIAIPFTQPAELSGTAGNDLVIYTDQTYLLGSNIVLQGGTPEYNYNWVTPASDTIPGQTLEILNSTGTFYLIITDANNCTFSDPVTVSYATSANNPDHPVNRIYPNPAHDYLHYRLSAGISPTEITLLNLKGEVILKKVIPASAQLIEGDLDVRLISPGSYFISIKTTLSEYSGKIVINR